MYMLSLYVCSAVVIAFCIAIKRIYLHDVSMIQMSVKSACQEEWEPRDQHVVHETSLLHKPSHYGVYHTSSCGQDLTSTSFRIVSSAGGFGVSLSTMSGMNGNKPVVAHAAVMFLLVNALSGAGLYREVKCSLLTVSAPP
jgi:hypothetical protein